MSFFDDASLAFLPSGAAGKDGKAYSIKPTDGTGDFTFSRGSNLAATRVGADGLIEKGRENLLKQSNAFSTSPWGNTSISFTSGQTGYDGSSDAWIIERVDVNGQIYQTPPLGNVMTFSIYTKANTLNWIRIRTASVQNAYFNLDPNYTGNRIGYTQNVIDATITDVGNGWFRCTATAINYDRFVIYPAVDDQDVSGTTGSIYTQDSQAELGLAATDYIESGATTGKAGLLEDEPRFDYSGGATCPSLLLEPSRTNLVDYSEDFSQWPVVNSIILVNNIISPEGILNASRITATSSGDAAFVRNTQATQATTTTYSFSCFVKKGTTNFVRLANRAIGSAPIASAWFDIENGVVGTLGSGLSSSKIEDFGNGWYRCIAIGTTGSTIPNQLIDIAASTSDGTFSVSTNDYIFYWGAQFEAGSYPTSYIPNHSGGSVTRGVDSCSVTGVSDLIGQTEGTLYAEVDWNVKPESGSPVIGILTLNNGANNLQNAIVLGIERKTGGTNRVYCFVINSNVVQTELFGSSITDGTYKIALAYKANDFALYVNGSQIATDTSGSVPALSEVLLGKRFGTDTYNTSDGIKQALLFNERLNNADLETLTTL